MKVYYTFGTDELFPFRGGWVEINAPTMREAHAVFRENFPDRPNQISVLLNCSDYYTEEEFEKTSMTEKGNLGAFCHKKLCAKGTDIEK